MKKYPDKSLRRTSMFRYSGFDKISPETSVYTIHVDVCAGVEEELSPGMFVIREGGPENIAYGALCLEIVHTGAKHRDKNLANTADVRFRGGKGVIHVPCGIDIVTPGEMVGFIESCKDHIDGVLSRDGKLTAAGRGQLKRLLNTRSRLDRYLPAMVERLGSITQYNKHRYTSNG